MHGLSGSVKAVGLDAYVIAAAGDHPVFTSAITLGELAFGVGHHRTEGDTAGLIEKETGSEN